MATAARSCARVSGDGVGVVLIDLIVHLSWQNVARRCPIASVQHIDAREFSVHLNGGFIVRPGRIFFASESPDVLALAFCHYHDSPSIFSRPPRHTFVLRRLDSVALSDIETIL